MTQIATLAKTNRKEFKRFGKFLVVGITGFIVDFGIFNLLLKALNFNPVLAQAISFTLAAINNFLWNRYWTYPDSRSKPILRQFGMFFVLSAIGLAIRTPIFSLMSGPAAAIVNWLASGPIGGLINFAVNTLHLTTEQIAYNLA